jgi:hypothetical protein
MDELWQRDIYINVKVELIEETEKPEIAEAYDYFYVPSYYLNGELVHEGAATFEEVEAVFRRAVE